MIINMAGATGTAGTAMAIPLFFAPNDQVVPGLRYNCTNLALQHNSLRGGVLGQTTRNEMAPALLLASH